MLAAGDLRATVAPEQGGRVAGFWRDNSDGSRSHILVPMGSVRFDPLAWPKAGLYPLAPWSNRIANARFSAAGRAVALTPHPACPPHALHGFSHTLPWSLEKRGATSLSMRFSHDGAGHEWPWSFEVEQSVRLDAVGLTLEMSIVNRSREPMPAGFGAHPFFAASAGDEAAFSAGALWDVDDAGCAIAKRGLTAGDRRLRIASGSEGITAHFSEWDGIAALNRRDGSRILLQASPELRHLVVHAPGSAGYFCLEPVSHVVDAFNLTARGQTGAGTILLEPDERRSAVVRISLL
ncbi:MAG: hypothetical protein BGP06_15725 [Rhizobiales bacterium 65-9]|nr:aldose 1-epimerase [Hyphomicrobiales bacterium]OJY37935.1 MAG: hypothetical protein BGP06_15725 [Rhizobiales bacterium 65-9]